MFKGGPSFWSHFTAVSEHLHRAQELQQFRCLMDRLWHVNCRMDLGMSMDVVRWFAKAMSKIPSKRLLCMVPMPPSQETPEQVRLRWKSKWDARTGTARAIGFPAPDSFAGLGYTQSLHKLGFSSPSNTHQHNHYIFGRLTVAGRERIWVYIDFSYPYT